MNDDVINKFNLVINKYIKKDKINHAYLLETNYDNKIELAKEIVKTILSYESKVSIEDLELNGDLIVISNESNIIKTEDIELIKEKFKTKSILNSKRIYIIDGAEKLNNYAANKLLKFLEEPEEDIVAILTTENKNNVINTIVSRCIGIRFITNNIKEFDQEYVDKLFSFIDNVEENKEKAIAFQNIYDVKELSDRNYLKEFLNNLLLIYDDVIQYKICNKVNYFPNNIEKIGKICEDNNIEDIKRKINGINECINRLKFNPNVKLLIDKLIILMSGVDIDA